MIAWLKWRYYITREEARTAGYTHEGTLYGVPAWFLGDGMTEGEYFLATPKFMPLERWTLFCEWLYDQLEYLVPAGVELTSFIRVTGPIR